ncbi:MAG: AAA family ATPase [Pirellulaceae bacterium]
MTEENEPQAVSKFYFSASPFPAMPQVDAFCRVGTTEETRRRLKRSIERAEGPSIVVGGPGLGKSLLCNVIANDYRDTFHVALLSEWQIDNSLELLQAIMFQLNLPYRDQEEGELRLALIDFLRPKQNSGDNGALLIVDEAQSLTPELLEEIRMISNITSEGRPRVRTLLAGGPRLDENLADPRMASFAQRIAARCYLHPLTAGETSQYIKQQLMRVGAEPSDLIEDAAIQSVHTAADGIPRLINQLMNHVLYFAENERAGIITAHIVQCAWADLQQLPAPPTKANRLGDIAIDFAADDLSSTDPTIEFGELSDGSDRQPSPDFVSSKGGSQSVDIDRTIETESRSSSDESPCDRDQTTGDAACPQKLLDVQSMCVVADSSDSASSFEFNATVTEATTDPETISQACGCQSAIADCEVTHSDVQPAISLVVGQFDDESAEASQADGQQASSKADADSPVEENGALTSSPKQATGLRISVGTADEGNSDGVIVKPFRDFPVVRLTGKLSIPTLSKATDSRETLVGDVFDVPRSTSSSSTCDGQAANEICFEQQVSRGVDPTYADQVRIEVELNNVTSEPISTDAVFGTIDDQIWNASDADRLPLLASRQTESDPFGEDYEEELVVKIDRIGDLTRQALNVSGDDGDSTYNTNPQRLSVVRDDGNDCPTQRQVAVIREHVVSLNQAAIATEPDVVAGYFNRDGSRGDGAHSRAGLHPLQDIQIADDRDLLIIEDEYQPTATHGAALGQPAAVKTLNDLTTLFSRIRKG